jgi:hypothetical protein
VAVSTSVQVREVTDDEVAFFQENGWVKLERLIPPELAGELLETGKQLLGPEGDSHEVREKVDVEFDLWNDYHFPAREAKEPFAALSYSPEMGRNAQRLMGRDIAVRHFADMLGARAPLARGGKAGEATYHQDYPGGHFDRRGNVVFWFPLHDMPPEQGVMRFISGAQREGSLGYRPPDLFNRYPHLLEQYSLSPPMHLKAGDATVHSHYTFHGSPPNSTDLPRWHYSTIYIPADMRWTGHFFHGADLVELEPRGLFDLPVFPIVYPPDVTGDPAEVPVGAWRPVGEPRPVSGGWEWDLVRLNRVRIVRVEGVQDAPDRGRSLVESRIGSEEEPPTVITA